jgi:transcriptional regulator with XRE-family HTH domain|tara:strand:+ start:5586 stop:6437 length:852 start_codon:yes stop_codon:yes gene_type:complete
VHSNIDSSNAGSDASNLDTELDFGARLREARELKGITLNEIAAATKISISVLEALEQNDISRLPGGIFSRAFIRSYANAVGLDPEKAVREFLDEFSSEINESSTSTRSTTSGHLTLTFEKEEDFESQRLMTRTLIKLLAVSVPLAGLIIYCGSGRQLDTVQNPLNSQSLSESTSSISVSEMAGVSVNSNPLEDDETDLLLIDVHPVAPCWVSLTVDGTLAFSRLMQPGDREVLQAREEIVLNVGDAGAFAFSLNQQPGKPLGNSGQVITVRINQDNIEDFVVQ